MKPIPRTKGKQYPLTTKYLLRKHFIQGQGSLRHLSNVLEINFQTARNWSRDDKWSDKRRQWRQRAEADADAGSLAAADAQAAAQPTLTSRCGRHLEAVDDLISSAQGADEMLKLLKAKREILELAHLEAHGTYPGTQKPDQKPQKRGQRVSSLGPALPDPETIEEEPIEEPQEI